MPAPGGDELVAELLPNVRDVDIEQVGQRAIVLVEQVLVKHRAGHDLTTMEGEVFHEGILARGEGHRGAAPRNRARRGVDVDVPDR